MSKLLSHRICAATFLCFSLTSLSHAVQVEQGSLSGGQAQGSTEWQMYQQMQQMQDEIRRLRGQIEDQQNTIDKTQSELKNRYTDLDQRLDAMSPDHAKTTDAASANNASTGATATTPAASSSSTDSTATPNTPAPVNGTPLVTGDKAPDHVPATADTDSGDSKTASKVSDRDAYIGAYEIYKSGGADKAIDPMQQFISDYPNSVFVPNAYYWLGEFYLSSTSANYDKAKQNFATVINRFPKSAKAPTALYRLATITQEVDHRPQDALVLMKKLVQNYPGSQEATMAKTFIKSHS